MLSQGNKSDSCQKLEMGENMAAQGYNTCILSLKQELIMDFIHVWKKIKNIFLWEDHILVGEYK